SHLWFRSQPACHPMTRPGITRDFCAQPGSAAARLLAALQQAVSCCLRPPSPQIVPFPAHPPTTRPPSPPPCPVLPPSLSSRRCNRPAFLPAARMLPCALPRLSGADVGSRAVP